MGEKEGSLGIYVLRGPLHFSCKYNQRNGFLKVEFQAYCIQDFEVTFSESL